MIDLNESQGFAFVTMLDVKNVKGTCLFKTLILIL